MFKEYPNGRPSGNNTKEEQSREIIRGLEFKSGKKLRTFLNSHLIVCVASVRVSITRACSSMCVNVCVCARVNFQLMILDYHDLYTCSLCCAELGAYTGSVYCLKSFFMLFWGDYTGLVHCLTSFSCRFGRFK